MLKQCKYFTLRRSHDDYDIMKTSDSDTLPHDTKNTIKVILMAKCIQLEQM